jgi:hypothetical protein
VTDQPETLSQAREWDHMRRRYGRLGLCNRCAAQAAYGHADGFSAVHPPCTGCVPAIATLPTSQPNGWRSQSRRQGKALSPAVRAPHWP